MPRRASCLLLALSLLSCTSERIENSWLNPRPEDAAQERWQEVPPARFREVTSDARAEAVRLLEDEAAARLPGRDVHRFAGAGFSEQPAGRFYLLRAVALGGQNGSYQILTRGRSVTVRFNASGGSKAAVQSAIVADLEQPPERVYVELNVAQ